MSNYEDWTAENSWDEDPPLPAEEEPQLHFSSLDEFVREYLRHIYKRRIDGRNTRWAGRWWENEEALIRLEALWRSWEHLRLDPSTGISVWLRDHLDPQMSVLLSPDGPFALATEGPENTNRAGEPLPYVTPPAALFSTDN